MHYRPISYLKTALLWAFYYLKKEYTFEQAMRDIINRQGDTDANAAIVGGLLGAAYGIEGIRSELIDKVMRFESNRPYQSPKDSLAKLIMIAVDSPTELKVSWNNETFEGAEGLQNCEEKWNSL